METTDLSLQSCLTSAADGVHRRKECTLKTLSDYWKTQNSQVNMYTNLFWIVQRQRFVLLTVFLLFCTVNLCTVQNTSLHCNRAAMTQIITISACSYTERDLSPFSSALASTLTIQLKPVVSIITHAISGSPINLLGLFIATELL